MLFDGLKITKFCEISTVDLSYVVPVKSTLQISQNFVAFSEYINFNGNQQSQCVKLQHFRLKTPDFFEETFFERGGKF